MERLISLFREADYEEWSASQAQAPPREHDEPLYFEQLLEYLRKDRAEDRKEQNALAGGASNGALKNARL